MVQHPAVRQVEPVQLPQEPGEELPRFLLRDSANLATEQVIVTLPGLYMVELADGSRSISDITQSLHELTGLSVQETQTQQLLECLDQRFLLDNERARMRLAELSPRPMRHAGSGYPTSLVELEPFLDDLLAVESKTRTDTACRASILPHIDFFRGRESYRAGYQHLHGLAQADQPPTVVILGISHAYSRTPFILTKKSFDTPLGVVQTDTDLVDQLAENLPFDPYKDEYNHIGEHSVEFHAVLLKRLAPEVRIVPVLCRSFHEAIQGGFDPLQLPGVSNFLQNLTKLRSTRPDIHFMASVDLAHMGVDFGGPPLSREFLTDLERRDLETLKGVSQGKACDCAAVPAA